MLLKQKDFKSSVEYVCNHNVSWTSFHSAGHEQNGTSGQYASLNFHLHYFWTFNLLLVVDQDWGLKKKLFRGIGAEAQYPKALLCSRASGWVLCLRSARGNNRLLFWFPWNRSQWDKKYKFSGRFPVSIASIPIGITEIDKVNWVISSHFVHSSSTQCPSSVTEETFHSSPSRLGWRVHMRRQPTHNRSNIWFHANHELH